MSTGTSISGSINYSFTQNSIVSSMLYGQYNKSQFQYVNVNGTNSMYAFAGYNRSFFKRKLRTGVNLNFSHYINKNIVNSIENITNTNSIGVSPTIFFDKTDKFSLSIRSSINFSSSIANTGNTTSRNTWSHNHNVSGSVYLPWKLELSTEASMNFQPYNATFKSSMSIIKWNAALTKKISKDGKTEAKLAIYDILNQATGYYRYASGNNISESTSNYIPRYVMLSFTWNFTHMHK